MNISGVRSSVVTASRGNREVGVGEGRGRGEYFMIFTGVLDSDKLKAVQWEHVTRLRKQNFRYP